MPKTYQICCKMIKKRGDYVIYHIALCSNCAHTYIKRTVLSLRTT